MDPDPEPRQSKYKVHASTLYHKQVDSHSPRVGCRGLGYTHDTKPQALWVPITLLRTCSLAQGCACVVTARGSRLRRNVSKGRVPHARRTQIPYVQNVCACVCTQCTFLQGCCRSTCHTPLCSCHYASTANYSRGK